MLKKKIFFFNIILIILIFFGAFFRLYKLTSDDLWFDEIISIFAIKELIGDFPLWISAFPSPPLYYFILKIWTAMFNISDFSVRFLSALFGIFSIPLVYLLGKKFFNKKIGLISCLFFSISPIHIWYSQEARVYTMMTFFILLTIYFFYTSLEKNSNFSWVLFTIFSILSIYLSYFSFFIIPASGICFFSRRYRVYFRKWILSVIVIILAFTPWLYCFLEQINFISKAFWPHKPNLNSLLITFENFNIGYNGTRLTYFLSSVIFFTFFIMGSISLRKYKYKLLVLWSFLFIPIIISFLASRWINIYVYRQFIAFSPLYYIVVAVGIDKIRYSFLKKLIIIIIFLLCLFSLKNYYSGIMLDPEVRFVGTYVKKPYKPAVKYVNDRLKKTDIIAATIPSVYEAFWYYGNFGLNKMHYFYILEAVEEYWGHWEIYLKNQSEFKLVDLNKDIENCKFNRIWLIASSWPRDGSLSNNSIVVRNWLDKNKNYNKISYEWVDGILIILYKKVKVF